MEPKFLDIMFNLSLSSTVDVCVCRSGVTLLSIKEIVTAGDEKLLQRWKMCMYILFGGLSSSSVAHYGKSPTLRVVYIPHLASWM